MNKINLLVYFSLGVTAARLLGATPCLAATSAEKLESAQAAESDGALVDAFKLYREAGEDPQLADSAILGQIRTLRAQSRQGAAVRLAEEYLSGRNSFNTKLRAELASLYIEAKQFAKAKEQINHIEQIDGHGQWQVIGELRGELAASSGQFADAAKIFGDVLELNPGSFTARLGRAKALYQDKQFKASYEEVIKVVRFNPNNRDSINLVCDLYASDEELRVKARPLIDSAKRTYGGTVWLNEKLGDIYSSLKQFDQAVDFYEAAIRSDSNDARLRTKLASYFLENQKFDDASNQFAKALSIEPDKEEAQFGLLKAYRGAGKNNKVGQLLQTWFGRHPEKEWIALSYARSLSMVANYEGAFSVLEKHAEINGSPSPAVKAFHAFAMANMGQYKEALSRLSILEHKYADRGDIKYFLGVIYEKLGAVEKSVSKYSEVTKNDGDYFKKAQSSILSLRVPGTNSNVGREPAAVQSSDIKDF